MHFHGTGRTAGAKYRNVYPYLYMAALSVVVLWCLALDSAVVELSCLNEKCQLRRNPPSQSLWTITESSIQHFDLYKFQMVNVERENDEFRSEIVLDDGITLPLHEYTSKHDAENDAVRIDAMVSNAKLEREFHPNNDISTEFRIETSTLDEILLIATLSLACWIGFGFIVEEHTVINANCGVAMIERKTMFTQLLGVVEASFGRSLRSASHISLFVPLNLIQDISEVIQPTRTWFGALTRGYGIMLSVRGGLSQALRLGKLYVSREANTREINELRGLISEWQSTNDSEDSEPQSLRTGGEPGSRCVICLDRVARMAFAPCAHVCCCEVCGQSRQLRACPICRTPIVHRIGLYFS